MSDWVLAVGQQLASRVTKSGVQRRCGEYRAVCGLFCSPTSGGRLRNTPRWAFRRSFWPFSCQQQFYQALSGTTAVSPSWPSGFLSTEKCSGSAADWQVKVGVRALVHEGQVAGHKSRGQHQEWDATWSCSGPIKLAGLATRHTIRSAHGQATTELLVCSRGIHPNVVSLLRSRPISARFNCPSSPSLPYTSGTDQTLWDGITWSLL
jgi:hypothetical protein